MRQLLSLAALLLLVLASAPGCRSIDGHRTAARSNGPHPPVPEFAGRTAAIIEDRIERVGFDTSASSSTPVSFLGILGESAVPVPRPADAETLDEIVIGPQPETVPNVRWGHTGVAEGQAASEVTYHNNNDWLRPRGRRFPPDSPIMWTRPQMEIYEESFGVAANAIRIGDELEIKFPHKPLFSEKVMVREDGMIAVPLIPPVMAAGLTPELLQQELVKQYRALQYDPSAVRNSTVDKKYLLSVKDKLDIRFDTNDANSPINKLNDSVIVRPDGKISLPLIGTVIAEGKTPEELEAVVAARYQMFYKEAKPILIVREFTNNQVLVDGRMQRTGMKDIDDVVVLTRTFDRMVFVGGEVSKPGFVKLRGPMTASQAIIAAGGPKRTAEMRTVARFHEGPHRQAIGELLNLKTQWNYETMKRVPVGSRKLIYDPLLSSNDVIIVPMTTIAKVTDALEQYVYQIFPFTRNTSFQYTYFAGTTAGVFGF